ncbi:toxin [Campylobacter sp. MIT 12-5580]|uniref:toxin n=1 Tax=Campylobacter sp. MIT 12-5580 TaxID=2040651 RepID=UPI0010F4C19B|nr:toxin [Campylobacter sp. MIT 12-5580]TKX29646.1 toxin [Campylobacter sp. MIT 12-5580]
MKKHLKFYFLIGFLTCFLLACSAKEINPLSTFGDKNDSDPLKIGKSPTLPAKQDTPSLLVGQIFMPEEKNKNFDKLLRNNELQNTMKIDKKPLLQALGSSPSMADSSDWFSLMAANGAVLTVWALAQGNWLWGYTLIDSVSFGDARVWKFRLFANNEVLIQNAKTNTCVNTYGNGVIHSACDESNVYQRFKLIPMSNEAFMLQNTGTKRCLQVPIGDIFYDFHRVSGIYLSTCNAGDNLDQQFYIIPPPFLIRPLYDRR